MKNIWNLVDNSLGQCESAVAGVESTFIKWEKDLRNKKDKIFYWGDYDFFYYSPYPEFKMFISKNEPIMLGAGAYGKVYKLNEKIFLNKH